MNVYLTEYVLWFALIQKKSINCLFELVEGLGIFYLCTDVLALSKSKKFHVNYTKQKF